MCVYFWALYCSTDLDIYVFVPMTCFLVTVNFVVLSEVQEGYASTYSFSSVLLMQFCSINFSIICSSSVKNVMCNLIWIALNLQVALCSMTNLTILIFPIQEHGISFQLLNHLQFPLSMIYISQSTGLSPPWLGLFLWFFGPNFKQEFFLNFLFVIFHCQCKETQQISEC